MLNHRPVHIPVKADLQTMGTQRLDSIQIGKVHFTQCLDFAWPEVHIAQRSLIPFGQAGVAYATIIMTILVLIFSEVLPKTYALHQPDQVSRMVAMCAAYKPSL